MFVQQNGTKTVCFRTRPSLVNRLAYCEVFVDQNRILTRPFPKESFALGIILTVVTHAKSVDNYHIQDQGRGHETILVSFGLAGKNTGPKSSIWTCKLEHLF